MDIEKTVYQLISRWMAERYAEKHGVVTSYDPDKHLAKVKLQPEGQETGWVPIETGHIGQGWGIAIGLTPGNGDDTGDQVIVRFQEGDIESGKIVQRVHSDKDKPPKVESGEMVFWHEKGAKILFAKDGTLSIFGPGSSDDQKSKTVYAADKSINNTSKKNITNQADQAFSVSAQTTTNAGTPSGWDAAGH